jgi:hypothetical protein
MQTLPTNPVGRPTVLARVRRRLVNQVQLWNRMLADLQPWEDEGPLRWHGARLDGAVLVDPQPRLE